MPVIELNRVPKKREFIYRGSTRDMSLSERTKAIKTLWGKGRPRLAVQIDIGELLTDYKQAVAVGKWLNWIARLPFSERTARTYMGLFWAYRRGYITGVSMAREEIEQLRFEDGL
jgi:hypothetical protein